MTQKRTYEELEERIQILEQEELTRNQVSEIWGDSMVLRSHFSQDEEIVCFEDIQRLRDGFPSVFLGSEKTTQFVISTAIFLYY